MARNIPALWRQVRNVAARSLGDVLHGPGGGLIFDGERRGI
ncbi:hypothetical protein SACS_0631 [Parasaccharibacter apium]|uniref:Uncharacterized protein n=1 Tax=Parasaccharibacter apium TaxID=1510841 RepID=A0A7U7G574_9PROT|nr:hypothetical protein SACS_0631 [Parasaccharibacter apium]